MSPEVLIVCGVGGTGKTTTSAALGLAHAQAGRRAVVLTIDPARRLADALGLEALGNDPRPVALPEGTAGTLHALMLDRKGTWDAAVRRFSANDETAEKLLANRYYRAVTTRLSGSHEYMAIEKLYDLVHSGEFDVVVVDTPPAEHALDFFRAPERVGRVLDRTALSMLSGQGGGLLSRVSSGAGKVFQRLAGQSVLEDIREFFQLIAGLAASLRERSADVAQLLKAERTRYLLVTDAEAPERNDVLGFRAALRERGLLLSGYLVNRVARGPALALRLDADALGEAPAGVSPADWQALVDAMLHIGVTERQRAQRHLEAAAALADASGGAPIWLVPELVGGVRSLEGLVQLAPHLPPSPPASLR